jgi:NET1-associated nuclear protein 1 (U3 small nucleolar RNA-associated protein 17)
MVIRCVHLSQRSVRCSLQCVAVSPCNDRVAAGDATGRILVWHGVGAAVAAAAAGDDAKQLQQQMHLQQDGAAAAPPAESSVSPAHSAPQPVVTSVHWHAHAVRALAFSLDAQRLLSGGDEAVLVRHPSYPSRCITMTCMVAVTSSGE